MDSLCDTCTHRLPGLPGFYSPGLHILLGPTPAGCDVIPVDDGEGRAVLWCEFYEEKKTGE
jgi:hypothetical protein